MLKKTISYVDYDGNQRTEDFYFNLTKAELMEMQLSEAGGLKAKLERIMSTQDTVKLAEIFKEIILKAYGEKSDDGRRFIKNAELTESFTQTEAYSELYMELATDDVAAANFINELMPSDIAEEIKKEQNKIAVMPGSNE